MSRSFYVGEDITEEDIHGKFENGILKLDIPKVEAKKVEQIIKGIYKDKRKNIIEKMN